MKREVRCRFSHPIFSTSEVGTVGTVGTVTPGIYLTRKYESKNL
jgi:hypothetical protein